MDARTVELDPFEEMPPSVRMALGREEAWVAPDSERLVDLWDDGERL